MKRASGSVAERILRLTDRSGECWLWTLRTDRDGYGSLNVGGRARQAHQASYEAHIGPIPQGMEIDHLCRVRHCVNPDHLELVTHAENVLRSAPAQKAACVNGHAYTPENTYLRPGHGEGRRDCRTCIRDRTRRYVARKRKETAA